MESTKSVFHFTKDIQPTSSKIRPRQVSLSLIISNVTQQIKTDCNSIYSNKDLNGTINFDSSTFPPYQIALPCGILSKYYPTDSFSSISSIDGTINQGINSQNLFGGISRYNFSNFINYTVDSNNKTNTISNWTDLSDDRFSNWMVCLTENEFLLRCF